MSNLSRSPLYFMNQPQVRRLQVDTQLDLAEIKFDSTYLFKGIEVESLLSGDEVIRLEAIRHRTTEDRPNQRIKAIKY